MAPDQDLDTDQVVDLTNDSQSGNEDEDEDLKRAIALSLQDLGGDQHVQKQDGEDVFQQKKLPRTTLDADSSTNELAQVNVSSMLGLDRKAMEAERLARLKRKREIDGHDVHEQIRRTRISPPPLRRGRGDNGAGFRGFAGLSSGETVGQKRMANGREIPERRLAMTGHGNSSSTAKAELQYSKGVVLQTPSSSKTDTDLHSTSQDRCISFSALIDAENLQSCLLSSFIWDFDWLFPHFRTKDTNFLLVMQAKGEDQRRQISTDFGGIPNIRLCFPSMDGLINCMHSKLMLLFYEHHCRIVVPTANLVGFDWGVGNVMENTVWLIDIPLSSRKRPPNEERTNHHETYFQRNLLQFLKALTVPEDVIQKLNDYDFSETSNLGFVHNIGGSHGGETWRTTGFPGMCKTVSELGLATQDPIQVDYVTSSVGSLNDQTMSSIYLAAQGQCDEMEKPGKLTIPKPRNLPAKDSRSISKLDNKAYVAAVGAKDSNSTTREGRDDWKKNFRIYFPSDQTVHASKGGPASAGTICFNRSWWEGAKFPRTCMRDCVSVREGMLMHNKIMFVRYMQARSVRRAVCIGWAYVGSGNLSESAWGRLVNDKVSKLPKLNSRNWECGVIMPVIGSAISKDLEHQSEAGSGLKDFVENVPVPMRYPGYEYADGTRKPWYFRKTD